MGYEGRIRLTVEDRDEKIDRAYATLAEVRAGAPRRRAFRSTSVSASGTSTLREAIADPTITELQVGVYCADGARAPGHGPPVPLRGDDPRARSSAGTRVGSSSTSGAGSSAWSTGRRCRSGSRQAASPSTTSTRSSPWPTRFPPSAASWTSCRARSGPPSTSTTGSGSAGAVGFSIAGPSPRAAARGDAPHHGAVGDGCRHLGGRALSTNIVDAAHERVRAALRARDRRGARRPDDPGAPPGPRRRCGRTWASWPSTCAARRRRCEPT